MDYPNDPGAIRPPLASVAAAQAVLGLLLRGEADWADVAPPLGPGDFADPAHAAIAATMQTLADMGRPCDRPMVESALEAAGRLADVGGAEFLDALTKGAGTAARLASYAAQIREPAARRRAIDAIRRGDLGAPGSISRSPQQQGPAVRLSGLS